jgi:hypothetical protein
LIAQKFYVTTAPRIDFVPHLFQTAGMDYAKHYRRLIERARKRRLWDCYYETHHIRPRCMGGGDEPENLVRLTPEEHYVAHQLLVKMHPANGKLLYAVKAMTMESPTHLGNRSNNKLYGWIQRRFSQLRRQERLRQRSGRKYGRADIAKLAAMLAPKQISA